MLRGPDVAEWKESEEGEEERYVKGGIVRELQQVVR
jgi:hypothetical protein